MMKHQLEGVEFLLNNPYVAIFDEPGCGKTRQVVEAANVLFSQDKIGSVLVIAPSQVLFNWQDRDIGEITRWHDSRRSLRVMNIADPKKMFFNPGLSGEYNTWFLSSAEWMRTSGENHFKVISVLQKHGPVLLVIDESSFLRNRRSKTWGFMLGPRYGRKKIMKKWKTVCPPAYRVVELNGTPTANSLLDLWGQFHILDKKILDCSYWEWQARHAIMGGWMNKNVIGYKDLDGSVLKKDQFPAKLIASLAPYVLCRRKCDVLDLPPVTHKVIEVPLDPDAWRLYREMRDEAFTTINDEVFKEDHLMTRWMRVSQITSGFLGKRVLDVQKEEFVAENTSLEGQPKVNWLLSYLEEHHEPVIVWCWFKEQLRYLELALKGAFDGSIEVFTLHGGTSKQDKKRACEAFHPSSSSTVRSVLLAQPAAGGMGLNLARASTNIYLSSDYSFHNRAQSEERTNRPGQVHHTYVIDVLATGPKGQRTIDHVTMKARLNKENLSTWTKEQWQRELL